MYRHVHLHKYELNSGPGYIFPKVLFVTYATNSSFWIMRSCPQLVKGLVLSLRILGVRGNACMQECTLQQCKSPRVLRVTLNR